jgi:hypothetical protein
MTATSAKIANFKSTAFPPSFLHTDLSQDSRPVNVALSEHAVTIQLLWAVSAPQIINCCSDISAQYGVCFRKKVLFWSVITFF